MDNFLLGFADELMKVAFVAAPSSSPTPAAPKPVSTGAGASPGYKPRANLAPSNKPFNIPKQRMESPAGVKQPTGRFRPSPTPNIVSGYAAPKKTKPKVRRRKGPSKPAGEVRTPWQTSAQRWGRAKKEVTHNYNRAQKAKKTQAAAAGLARRKKEAPAYAKWSKRTDEGRSAHRPSRVSSSPREPALYKSPADYKKRQAEGVSRAAAAKTKAHKQAYGKTTPEQRRRFQTHADNRRRDKDADAEFAKWRINSQKSTADKRSKKIQSMRATYRSNTPQARYDRSIHSVTH